MFKIEKECSDMNTNRSCHPKTLFKKFIFAGNFDGDESKLPHRDHPTRSFMFKEPEMKKFAIISNVGSFVLISVLCAIAIYFDRAYLFENRFYLVMAFPIAMITLIPHEFLHGLCFRETVYMYTNFKNGICFVVGTEDMSKL